MKRAIVTYAAGAHEELLDVALPSYKAFAQRHGYDLLIGNSFESFINHPPAWMKIPLLQSILSDYEEVVWFDCDLIVVDPSDDFPPLASEKLHALVRHFEGDSEVPNSGVWRVKKQCGNLQGTGLLNCIRTLDVFRNHGWWEQAALMTLMGYCVPPEGSHFPDTRCRCVYKTQWYEACQFMRLAWNSHPNYRADHPKVVHCSYPDMPRRLEVMRALSKDPHYNYPRFDDREDEIDL